MKMKPGGITVISRSNSVYSRRLQTLQRAYKKAQQSNKLYEEAQSRQIGHKAQVDFLINLSESLHTLDLAITTRESEWRKAILSVLETEIINDLEFVYPSDGYQVSLDTRVLRGKIHITATVMSTFANDFPGKIKGTQGRLFQQVVSFATLIGIMSLLGVKTIYVDEAFSGSSKNNIARINQLLLHFQERGFNLVIIAQDMSIATNIPANCIYLTRTTDNKTLIAQEEVKGNEYEQYESS